MNQSNQEIRPEDIQEVFRFFLSIEALRLSTRDDGMLQITERPDSSVLSCSQFTK